MRRALAPFLISLTALLFFLVLLPTPRQILYAQISGTGVIFQNSDPSGTCANPTPLVYDFSNGKLWGCDNGTWTQVGAGGGSVTSIATSAPITGGTITTTGTIACGTCATTTNGGALSGVAPITVSAAGAIGCASCSTSGVAVGLVSLNSAATFNIGATTTDYTQVNIAHPGTTESSAQSALGTACTAKNLTVSVVIAGQPSTGTLVVTLRQNAASPSNGPVVTIPISSGVGVFQDVVHTVALAATDLIDYQIANAASTNSADMIAITFVCQ
jgi:hypothetical protein